MIVFNLFPNPFPLVKVFHSSEEADKVEWNGHCYCQPFRYRRENMILEAWLVTRPVEAKVEVKCIVKACTEKGCVRKDEGKHGKENADCQHNRHRLRW